MHPLPCALHACAFIPQVRQLILKRMLKRRRKSKGGGDSSDEEDPNNGGRGFQWTDSGRSSYQHHIATVYATAVVAGLRIGQTTDRVLHKVGRRFNPC